MSDDDELLQYPLLALMKRRGIPFTRKRYLAINHWGEPPREVEDELELPPQLRKRERPGRRR
jgi:hypothetical protein